MKLKDYIVSAEGVIPYPAPEIKSTNRRLVGQETVGAQSMEVIMGQAEAGSVSREHTHEVEQVIFVLEGGCVVEMFGEKAEVGPNQAIFIPPGVPHQLTVLPDRPMKDLLIFAPPIQWGGVPSEDKK